MQKCTVNNIAKKLVKIREEAKEDADNNEGLVSSPPSKKNRGLKLKRAVICCQQ